MDRLRLMHPQTIYTKTAKGVLEIRNKTVKLSRELNRIFLLVDGKSTVAELLGKDRNLEEPQLQEWLSKLEGDGYIRVFSTPAQAAPAPAQPVAAPAPTFAPLEEEAELDFTSPEVNARLSAEA